MRQRSLVESRKPYLRVANVYANRLELDDVAEIGLTDAEFAKTKLAKDDLLIVEGNGSLDQIGRAALWTGEITDCVHQNHIIRWRAFNRVLPIMLCSGCCLQRAGHLLLKLQARRLVFTH